MKSIVIYAGVLCVVVSSVFALPTSVGELKLNSFQNNFEVVDGPKEFILPVAPLRQLLGERFNRNFQIQNEEGTNSDLKYMVYGKVYLMKMLGIREESGLTDENFVTSNREEVTKSNKVSSVFNGQPIQGGRYQDAIAFPMQPQVQNKARRTYRYLFNRNTSNRNQDVENDYQISSMPTLKIEERSVPQHVEVKTSPMTSTLTPSISLGLTDSAAKQSTTDSSIVSDEEASDLIERFYETTAETRRTGFSNPNNSDDIAVSGNGTVAPIQNITEADIYIGDRFLLDVPSKPNPTQTTPCPDGQKRIQRGVCKPVYTHNPSPQDGIYAGKLTPDVSGQSASKPSLHLGTVFRSFVQLQKSLRRQQASGQVQPKNSRNYDV